MIKNLSLSQGTKLRLVINMKPYLIYDLYRKATLLVMSGTS